MPPRIVPCRCCSCGCVVSACCPKCEAEAEHAQLHRLMLRRGDVSPDHPAQAAWDSLEASYADDSFDREAAAAPGRDG